MSYKFPSELFPAVLPNHEESNPKWDAFCCWGSYGGVNVCSGSADSAHSSFRPQLVAQLAHGVEAALEQRYAAGGPSVPLGEPGTCAWLSQWASRETLLASLRPARRWASRRQDMVQRWIGTARAREDVRRDLEDLYGTLVGDDKARAAAVATAVSSVPRPRRRDRAPPESARVQVARLAKNFTDLFDEVPVPKANYDVGNCLKCVRMGASVAADGARDGAAMALASVDGASHADLRVHTFQLGLAGVDYPHIRRLRSASVTLPSAVRQVDMRAYNVDDGRTTVWCAIRQAGGAVSVHDVVLAADGIGCEDIVQLAECSPAGAHSVSLNPHWRGEWLTASRDGQVALWSVRPEGGCAGSFVRHGGCRSASTGVATGRPSQAHFGCHPRSAVSIEPTRVSLLDLRSAASDGVELFGLPSRLLHQHEYLVTAAQFDARPFYHSVLADHSLLLLDERVPGHCLLCCAIPCSSAATYLDVVSLEDSLCETSEAAVVIGCQEAQEAHWLTVSFSDPAPRLTSRPWRVGPAAEFVHLDAVSPRPSEMAIVDHRVSSAALMGVSVGATQPYRAGHSGSRLALFQLSSYGDLFVQSYSKQCVASADESSRPTIHEPNVPVAAPSPVAYPGLHSKVTADIFSEWTKALISQADWVGETSRKELFGPPVLSDGSISNVPADGCRRVDSQHVLARLTNARAVKAHIACSLCSDSGRDAFDNNSAGIQCGPLHSTTVEDHLCYACSLPLRVSASLHTAVTDDRVVPSDTDLEGFLASTSHFDTSKFVDPNSQLHLKLWCGEDIEENLKARGEVWRARREEQLPAVDDPTDASSEDESTDVSDEDSQCSTPEGAATGAREPPSGSSIAQFEGRSRHDSISSSAGFLTTPKRPRHQENSTAESHEAGESDEALVAVPLGFLSLSARATSPTRPSRTQSTQNRPKRQRLMEGF